MCYFCIEYIKISESAKFGVVLYKNNEINDIVEYNELYFFNEKLINVNFNSFNENNNKFNLNFVIANYKNLLNKIKKENNILKASFLQPPSNFFKREIALAESRWYFKNIFETYFCFCKGKSCIALSIFYMINFQSCKYFFYLTILDDNSNVYQKTYYRF